MSRMRLFYRVSRLICQVTYTGLLSGRVFGAQRVPQDGGVLLVSNHQSFFDPMLVTLALPRECSYMARDTLFKGGLATRILTAYNAFPIKRGAADLRGIKEALRRLKTGGLVTAFPEGTRTHDGTIGPMHGGIVMLARRANVPIVPTTILGAYKVWPRQAKFPRPCPVIVSYDRPLQPKDWQSLDDDAAIALVRERIVAMHDRYRNHPVLRA